MLGGIKPIVQRTPVVGSLWKRAARWYRSWPTRGMSPEEAFTYIFRRNAWKGTHSYSGGGSDLVQTRKIIAELPDLIKEFRIGSILDLPCGDFFWMRHVDLNGVRYIGGDIVSELILRNKQYETEGVVFESMDLLTSHLPKVDLVFCRDCLVHFSYKDIFRALDNISSSGSELLLTTTFPRHNPNQDIQTGEWRTLNLELDPFRLPKPLRLLEEGCTQTGGYTDKSLGLWRISDLRDSLSQRGAASRLAIVRRE
jgi:hypothetical protein